MIQGKPIIGLAGGIGSGKSFVAQIFRELGCGVITSDEDVRAMYLRADVKDALRSWWGDAVFVSSGDVDRKAVAARIFKDETQRQRLEGLIHPLVAARREQLTRAYAQEPQTVAMIWDTPLLYETGLNRECDAVVFVDASLKDRLERVQKQRGWVGGELERRENVQWPLDKKREISDYVISNTAEAGVVRDQVKSVLSLILSKKD
jgi:dephospho-CoA kinase